MREDALVKFWAKGPRQRESAQTVPEHPLLYPQEAQVRAGGVKRGKPREELVHAAPERPQVRLATLEGRRARKIRQVNSSV